ncbi:hypothetical protein DE146DRAFT_615461 [Phaeosphaeria sp. MPI-PUGE-AT-0046c]|nr:hypothetical protein DE146DRAFT_615461 [Phaeosphaeria sp. MPI-PUGE-AT-0046c]
MAARAGVSKRRVSHISTNANDVPPMSLMEDLFGEEFPEAFGSGGAKSSRSILDLPSELLAIICEDLSGLEIKRLRLASVYLAKNVDLRIDRVYISPNRANLQCLRNILDHPRHKYQIAELIWDDAQLDAYPDLGSFKHAIDLDEIFIQRNIEKLLRNLSQDHPEADDDFGAFEHDDLFDSEGKLTEVAKGVLLRHDSQFAGHVISRNATLMSVEESFEVYQVLYRQEQDIMRKGHDAAALGYALENCPNIVRVVLTSEVWRPWHLQPVYDTPFRRSLPPGFRKPSVWPWLSQSPYDTPARREYRDTIMGNYVPNDEASLPTEFRGFSIIVSALAALEDAQVSEFIIYPGHETIGISHHLFTTPNADFTNTLTMAQDLPLTRLALSINTSCSFHTTTTYLLSGQIRTLLASMSHLEHLDLSLNSIERHKEFTGAMVRPSAIFPANLLPRLKTLALRNATFPELELVSLIQALVAAQHITLDNIAMIHARHNFVMLATFPLFQQLWKHYHDNQLGAATRPIFTIIRPALNGYKARMVCEELCYWLYECEFGEEDLCPFDAKRTYEVKEGVGWVISDRDERYCVRAGEWEGWEGVDGTIL